MQFIKLLLLTGCLSIATLIAGYTMDDIKTNVLSYTEKEYVLGSNKIRFTLSEEPLIETEKSLIAKGFFNGDKVAVKFFMNEAHFDKEIAAYEALNAMRNPRVEDHGIPRIYYAGEIFKKTPAIVMTLFDGSLFDRWWKQKRKLDMNVILQVFLQSVKTLEYMHSKKVVHNDIKPQNIFFRDDEVFIGDFDLATINNGTSKACTPQFASSRYWDHALSVPEITSMIPFVRTAMEDLESLVYSIWHIKGMVLPNGHGLAISQRKAIGREIKYVTDKCNQFSNCAAARHACLFICKDQILSGNLVPEYRQIIHLLNEALIEARQMSEPPSS